MSERGSSASDSAATLFEFSNTRTRGGHEVVNIGTINDIHNYGSGSKMSGNCILPVHQYLMTIIQRNTEKKGTAASIAIQERVLGAKHVT